MAIILTVITPFFIKTSIKIGIPPQIFAEKYAVFLQTGDLSGLCDMYNASMAGAHRQAVLSGPGWEKTGTILGIDVSGALLLQLQDGSIEHVISGEVSLRGMKRYI